MRSSDAGPVPVLDPVVIAAIRSLGAPGEPDVYAEVARLFLHDVPGQLSALQAAIREGDAVQVRQVAHRLRGSTLEIGAARMAPLCAAIEQAGGSGSLAPAAADAAALEREFQDARRALEREIG